MNKRFILTALAFLVLSFSTKADTQDDDSSCIPKCRTGFVCVQSQCISVCNPPCGQGQICTAEATCVNNSNEGQVYSTSLQPAYSQPGTVSEPIYDTASGRPDNGFRLHIGPHFGFAGKFNIEVDDGSSTSDVNADAEASYGLDVRAMAGLVKYLSIGGGFRVLAMNNENNENANIDRSVMFDLSLAVRGRYPFHFNGMTLEPFAELVFGPSFYFLSDDAENQFIAGVGDKPENPAIGYHVGFEVGGTFFFNRVIGAYAKLGYRYQNVLIYDANSVEVSQGVGQMQLGLGASFRFGG